MGNLTDFLKDKALNRIYIIMERQDGAWEIVAFDSQLQMIGTVITCNTANQAWKLHMLLNGFHPVFIDDSTTGFTLRKAV